jgi:hypothetical protein
MTRAYPSQLIIPTSLGVAMVMLTGTIAPLHATAADSIALSPKTVSWGMPWDAVWNRLEPGYASRMDFSRPSDAWGMLEIKAYSYRGCTFSLKYWFYRDRLDALSFETRNDTRCISAIERELSAFYGPPQNATTFAHSSSLSWETDRARIALWRGRNNDVWLHFHIYDPQGQMPPDLAPDVTLNLDGGVPPR